MDILTIFDWINYIAEAALGALFAALSFRQAGKRKNLFSIFLCLCFCLKFWWVLGAEDTAWLAPGKDDKPKRHKIWQNDRCNKDTKQVLRT